LPSNLRRVRRRVVAQPKEANNMRSIGLVAASFLIATKYAMAGDVPPSRHHLHHGPGAYYPGYYYSRAYQQPFELAPGEQVLTFRLHPYQHYGRHGALDGSQMMAGESFAYRYSPGFKSALGRRESPEFATPLGPDWPAKVTPRPKAER
jgi:hypothetical protein